MFNFRPNLQRLGLYVEPPAEEDVPGLHNWRPNEEVPGLHTWRPRNADGPIREATLSAAPLHSDGSGDLFNLFERPDQGSNAFGPVGDGTPSPYLAFARGLNSNAGGASIVAPEAVQLSGMAPFASATSSQTPISSLSFAGGATDGPPLKAPPSLSFLGKSTPQTEYALLGDMTNPLPVSGQQSFNRPMPGEGLSGANADRAEAAGPDVLPVSNGQRSTWDRAIDPNIIRVGGTPALAGNETEIAQQQETQRPKLRKDPSPGMVVVLPDGSTITDPQSPTGKLMAPVADLNAVAKAGRETRETFRALAVTPIGARLYLAAVLGLNVGHGGTFDYQRRGNKITGYTHLQQFDKVSNLNVGLFAQQAGLTLEEILDIAGTFARNFSSNSDPTQPYGLSRTQLKFITRGYQIGESGVFDEPPPNPYR